jgi:hypothetical protein
MLYQGPLAIFEDVETHTQPAEIAVRFSRELIPNDQPQGYRAVALDSSSCQVFAWFTLGGPHWWRENMIESNP